MAARRVAFGIVVSRTLGVVREQVLAFYFGGGVLADAWGAATRIPGALQSLLGEGTLSASFVPVYARLLQQGREHEAARVARSVLGLLAAAAGFLALAGYLAAPWLVALFASGFDEGRAEMTTTLLRLFFPMSAALVLSAWTLGILNSHGRFFTAYVAPALWNVSIVAAVVAAAGWGLLGANLMIAMAWGAVAGGVLQIAFQLPFVFRHLRGAAPGGRRLRPETRTVVSNFFPAVAARGAANLSGLIDTRLASALLPGAVAHLRYATTLYLVPLALFVHSVTAAALPELARDRAAGLAAVRERTERAVRTTLFGLVAATVGFLVFREEVMTAVYVWGGEFGLDEAIASGWVLAAYAAGLPATGVSRVLAASFHGLEDTRTPARIALLTVGVGALVGLGLMFPLDDVRVGAYGLGAAGLALGSAIARWLELALLRNRLARRLGSVSLWSPGAGRVLGAVGAGTAAGLGLQALLREAAFQQGSALAVLFAYVVACLGAGEALGSSPFRLRAKAQALWARRRGGDR